MTLNQRFLTSRVARRAFFLFVLCALVPVTIFAVFSYSQVRSELRRAADDALRQATKTTGMTILERLLFLKADLERIAVTLEADPQALLADIPVASQTKERFDKVVLVDTNDPEAEFLSDFEQFNMQERPTRTSRTLLFTKHQSDVSRVVLVHPIHGSSRVLVAVVRPEYLWSADGFLPASRNFAILDHMGRPVSFSPLGLASIEFQRPLASEASGTFSWSHGDDEYVGCFWTLFMEHEFATQWTIIQSEERGLAFAALGSFNIVFALVVVLTLLVVAYASSTQIRQQLVPISKLIAATRKLRAREFSTRVSIDTNDEFGELGESFNGMAADLEHHLHVVKTSNVIGSLLSAEVDDRNLLQMVLVGLRRVTNADGAAAYLLDDYGNLELALVDIQSLPLQSCALTDMPTPAAVVSRSKQSQDAAARVISRIPDLSLEARAELERFEVRFDYPMHSWLSLPLKNHEKQLIGYVQVFNKCTDTEDAQFSIDDEEAAASLASQAAVAITKNRLVNVFQDMFEALTNLIALAIDEKSPYTGRHCQRVPVVAMMLAEAACKTTTGPLRDFDLTPAELYELKIAALLHDCGKVVTPVHVIDKATKLETILDRIDLIETRFQALKSQRELESIRRSAAAPAPSDDQLQAELAQIDADFRFLSQCNKGGEWMPEADEDRIRQIAARYQWTTPTGEVAPLLSDDEVENLCIKRGTLNSAEREIINYHVVASTKMLETLPYPKSLRAVPELAGAHHEKLDGSGYPQGLDASRLPMRARILAFADIFEALTAKDRPYKDGKKLSEAMRILEMMTRDGQLDADLLDVLVREKVHVRYAAEHLDPEQIDQTQFDHLLRQNHATSNETPRSPSSVP